MIVMQKDELFIKSLTVAYGERRVLNRVCLSIKSGEITAVIGPNGAGKTTLIKAVSGVVELSEGLISVFDRDITHLADGEKARFLAVVPQAKELPGGFSVYQTVMLGRTPYLGWLGYPDKTDHVIVDMALEKTNLKSLANHPVGHLSGGEQQRVLLARALAQNTPALLLDEPTTHLDLHHQTVFLTMLKDLVLERSLAVLMVLHDLNLVGAYADRVALLVDGEIQVIGTPEEVMTQENLARAYQVDVQVIPHPVTGLPLVIPERLQAAVLV